MKKLPFIVIALVVAAVGLNFSGISGTKDAEAAFGEFKRFSDALLERDYEFAREYIIPNSHVESYLDRQVTEEEQRDEQWDKYALVVYRVKRTLQRFEKRFDGAVDIYTYQFVRSGYQIPPDGPFTTFYQEAARMRKKGNTWKVEA